MADLGAYTKKGGPLMLLGGCHSVGVLMMVGGDVEEVFGYATNGHRTEYKYPIPFQLQ